MRLVRFPLEKSLCLALLLAIAAPARAQLTEADIAALRARGDKEGWTFTVGLSDATQYPLEQLCGSITPEELEVENMPLGELRDTLPDRFDWRDYGACTPVKNQGGCGSCWAFAAVGVVESFVAITRGEWVNLSEQWLVSCTYAGSCSGGSHPSALSYMSCVGGTDPCGDGGAVLESSFPYVGYDASCGCPYDHPYCIPGRAYAGSSVSAIKQAIYDHGPVSCSVYAGSAFHAYSGGVFNNCTSATTNHAVVLVGWDDTLGSEGVWIMRNSWGGWGEAGYMYIEYGCNRIGSSAYYATYDAADCNANGVRDTCELDCGEPGGDCDVPGCGSALDCNVNGVPDDCDVSLGTSPDCNDNGVPDDCDIASGTSQDDDGNGVPDECQSIVYVDGDSPGPQNGSSWANAFHSLQDAIAAAELGDRIRMAAGTYTPDDGSGHTSGDRSETFLLPPDTRIEGGFAGYGAGNPDERDIAAYETILSGDLVGDDGPGFANRADNALHVVTVSSDTAALPVRLDGITIAGGNADGAALDGLAAGLFNDGGVATLECCALRGNAATTVGGGCFQWGGGDTTLVNCTLLGNTAANGGALYKDSGITTLTHCSVVGNSAASSYGGIYRGSGTAAIAGCLLWGNTDAGGSDESAQLNTGCTVNYSCIQGLTGGLGGIGNIGSDPSMVDADGPDDVYGTADDDIGLLAGSPCIDAGDNDALPPGSDVDRLGRPRYVDDPGIADTGNGGAPLADIGAIEYQASPPATITWAGSLMDHGGIELTVDVTEQSVDPRLAGVQKVELTLSKPASVVSAAVDCITDYSGTATVTPFGSAVLVELSEPLPDADCCEISLAGEAVGSVALCPLAGDADRNGTVTTSDASAIKAVFGMSAVEAGAAYDLDCNGLVTTADFSLVKSRFGNSSPGIP